MKTQFRYEFRRNGDTITTRWGDRETARAAMARKIGLFRDCGDVAGDGDSAPDGSHPGCPRNGGLLSRDAREA